MEGEKDPGGMGYKEETDNRGEGDGKESGGLERGSGG